jgi:hypothetical protein
MKKNKMKGEHVHEKERVPVANTILGGTAVASAPATKKPRAVPELRKIRNYKIC